MRIRETIYEYGEDITFAKLDGLAKALLWLYAFQFEWDDRIPSRLTEREICAMAGMSQSTYYSKRVYLERLGWLKVEHMGFNKPCAVYPLIGNDDPDYEMRSWARWHPLEHSYFKLVRSEQLRMVQDGIDIPFSEVFQLFEDDDELYASFLEDDLDSNIPDPQTILANFVKNVEQWNIRGNSLYEDIVKLSS